MTKQFYSNLQKDYKKSNSERRDSIVQKNGFNSEEDYLNFLTYELNKIELREVVATLSKENKQNISIVIKD